MGGGGARAPADLLHIRVGREIRDSARGLALGIEVVAQSKRDERREPALLKQAAVQLGHFHQVRNVAARVPLDLGVSAEEHRDDCADRAVADLHLVLLDGGQAVERGGDLAKHLDLLRARHEHEGVEDALAHDERSIHGRNAQAAQCGERLALRVDVLAARERDERRGPALVDDLLPVVRVGGEVGERKRGVAAALHVLRLEQRHQRVDALELHDFLVIFGFRRQVADRHRAVLAADQVAVLVLDVVDQRLQRAFRHDRQPVENGRRAVGDGERGEALRLRVLRVGQQIEQRLHAALLHDALVQLFVRREVTQAERDLLLLAGPAHAPTLGDERLENLRHGAARARAVSAERDRKSRSQPTAGPQRPPNQWRSLGSAPVLRAWEIFHHLGPTRQLV